jgi:hypothetical protein
MDNKILKREELKKKLYSKISTMKFKNNKIAVNPKQYGDIIKQVSTEIDKIKNDERITNRMSELYKMVKKELNIDIPSPKELLHNIDLAKEKFKEYLKYIILYCKTENIKENIFKKYINSIYTKYYIEVLTIDVIPEKIRKFIDI